MTKSLFKTLLIFLICMSLFTSISSKAAYFEKGQREYMDTVINSISQVDVEQREAIKAYFTLRQHFQLDDYDNIVHYPDNYGGAYINEKNELVLRVTTNDEWVRDVVESVCLRNETIIIEPCKASLNEVVAEFLAIKELLPSELINSSYYSASLNSYVLRCYKENEKAVFEVLTKENVNDNIIIQIDEEMPCSSIQKDDTQNPRSSYLYGGTMLYYGSSPIGTMTICGSYYVGAYCVSNHCYLTAGHVAYNRTIGPTTDTLNQYSSLLCEYENNGIGDYAIVPAPASYLKSNQIYTSNSLGRTTVTKYYNNYDYPEGATVYKFGQATLVTYGTVSGISYTSYTDTVGSQNTLYGMIAVFHYSHNYICAPGDSGGPCWVFNEDDEPVLLGTVSGGTFAQGQTIYCDMMYVSPICYAVSNGFVPYNMTAVTSLY